MDLNNENEVVVIQKGFYAKSGSAYNYYPSGDFPYRLGQIPSDFRTPEFVRERPKPKVQKDWMPPMYGGGTVITSEATPAATTATKKS
ncbi:hypothetical protein [Allocoleopsis sp.]|uniref:hypothetical protein n=1 Tax=Allocoleopsis sp. TaxID=3088169 RepID=UPI002FD1AF03